MGKVRFGIKSVLGSQKGRFSVKRTLKTQNQKRNLIRLEDRLYRINKLQKVQCFKTRTGVRQEPVVPGAFPLVFCDIMEKRT